MNFVGSPVYLNVFGNLFKSLIQVWCQRVYLKYSNPRLHVKGLSIWDLRTMTMIPIIWITTWIIKRSMVTLLNSSGASFLPVHPVEILILVPPISYRTLCFRTLLLFISTKNQLLHFKKYRSLEIDWKTPQNIERLTNCWNYTRKCKSEVRLLPYFLHSARFSKYVSQTVLYI